MFCFVSAPTVPSLLQAPLGQRLPAGVLQGAGHWGSALGLWAARRAPRLERRQAGTFCHRVGSKQVPRQAEDGQVCACVHAHTHP